MTCLHWTGLYYFLVGGILSVSKGLLLPQCPEESSLPRLYSYIFQCCTLSGLYEESRYLKLDNIGDKRVGQSTVVRIVKH